MGSNFKMYWTAEDVVAVAEASVKNHFEPEDALAVIACESDFTPKAYNKDGHANGIFQMVESNFEWLGYHGTQETFRALPPRDQLAVSIKYFEYWRTVYRFDRWNNSGDFYLANFMPGHLGFKDDPGHILAQENGIRALIYKVNTGLDRDHDGAITVQDMRTAAASGCDNPNYKEAVPLVRDWFANGQDVKAAQQMLGLTQDGIIGRNTRAAIRKKQEQLKMVVDGRLSPEFMQAIAPSTK